MFEKVNLYHPDKVADRIAGAITDLTYSIAGGHEANPKIATEVLIGHGHALLIIETSVPKEPLMAGIPDIMQRICPSIKPELTNVYITQQDPHLAANQKDNIRCGDNGIFRGMPITPEQIFLATLASDLGAAFNSDGKYIVDDSAHKLIICQSKAKCEEILNATLPTLRLYNKLDYYDIIINPLGDWDGGTDVDCGATNRKLGSDMGDAVTGGGLHGKDLSKADVSVNVVCNWLAKKRNMRVDAFCAIGDDSITFRYEDGTSEMMSYAEVVERARSIIDDWWGFERFAEFGLI